jgi:hypothetical protein
MSGATGARPARALLVWERFLQIVIIRPNGGLFSELRNSGTPLRKLGGFSGTQGYLALLFATGGATGRKRKKLKHRENTGLARG